MSLDVKAVIDETLRRTKDLFGPSIPDDLDIEYGMSLDLGTSLGVAQRYGPKQFTVLFNPHLMLRASIDEIRETAVHEVCHVMDFAIVRQFEHGPSWKMLMKLHGYYDANPCHRVAVAGFKGKRTKFSAFCPKCAINVAVNATQKQRLSNGKEIRKFCHQCDGALVASMSEE